MKFRILTPVVAACLVAGAAAAQYGARDNKLTVGDEAPELQIKEWVKGEKVEKLVEGQVYVVEFWATWCAPCRKSIPHLTKLQEEYGDAVHIIGISDEKPSEVHPFVRKMGDKMDYRVAVDDQQRTQRAWMRAAGLNGIPSVFIVDQEKKVAFIGNPLDPKFDKALASIAEGRYDPELLKQAEPLMRQVDYSRKMKDWRVAEEYLDRVIALDPHVFNDEAILKFRILAQEKGAPDEAQAYARGEFLKNYSDDTETLGMLVKQILTDAELLRTDEEGMMALALEIAEEAYNRASTDPEAISVLAMASYHNGDYDKAVTLQKRAWFIADPDDKGKYKKALDQYQKSMQMHR